MKRVIGNESVDKALGGSLVKSLLKAFPEYSWQVWRFEHCPHGYWNDTKNHVVYFGSINVSLIEVMM